MTPHMKIGIAGVVIGLILLIINPWLAFAVIVLAVAIPGGCLRDARLEPEGQAAPGARPQADRTVGIPG